MRVKGSTDNRMLYGVLAGGAAVIVILLALAAGGGDETERVTTFTVPCRIEPAWEEASVAGGGEDPAGSEPGEIRIYLDTSHPMGGYLPPSGVESEAVFRAVAQLVPGHLVGRYSGAVRWFGVNGSLHPLDRDIRLTRALFTGGETRLELALADLLSALESGRAEAAVLITDLVSTTGPEGAMGAVEPLLRWNRTDGVRGGRYDLGLLAVRADYWGVTSSRCTGRDALGCWYSEHGNRYVPMTEVARRPLYFLFFGVSGKGEGGRSDGASRVEEAGTSFQAALDDLGFETRWELLTEGSRGRSGALVCSAYRGEGTGPKPENQFALVRNEDGRHECRRDEDVLLSCCVTSGGSEGAEISCEGDDVVLRSAQASWPDVHTRAEAGHLAAVVDCEALRREPPETPLLFESVVADVAQTEPGPWRDWSSRSDELEETLGGTLQMDLFVETARLRPDHFRIDLQEPVLRFEP